jgi:hypothetical protein
MAVELKNRIQGSLGLSLPVASLLQGPSVTELAAALLSQLPASAAAGELEKLAQMLKQLDSLSEEEAKAMLEQQSNLAAEQYPER